MASDLDQLVDMGFDRERSQLALQKSGNLPSAIDWLDQNSDKSLEDLKSPPQQEDESTSSDMPPADAQAKSMVCNECSKKFRGMAQAQYHAEKTGHSDFSESAEELAPLTEAEKAARLSELKQKLAEKRAGQAEEDKLAAKRNEEIRKKHTKEQEDAKEVLQRKEQMKEAQEKKREKVQEAEAKKRIKEKIEADKAERRRKADEEKAIRANPSAYDPQAAGTTLATTPSAIPNTTLPPPAAPPRTTANQHSEARLRLQTSSAGNVMKTFPAETTLFEVAHALSEETGGAVEVGSFTLGFPKKVFERTGFGMTLREAGLVPSAALIVR